jgi:hypothetical protein
MLGLVGALAAGVFVHLLPTASRSPLEAGDRLLLVAGPGTRDRLAALGRPAPEPIDGG